jgi:hypothetical protein
MKKGVDIEGSPERARDRGRLGFDLPEGEGGLLTDPVIVESQVRAFLAEVLDVRKGYNGGTIRGEDASGLIRAIAKRYADRFMGIAADGFSFTDWNSPEQLGQYLQRQLIGVVEEQAAEAFFLRLASDFIEHIVVPHEEDKITEDAVTFRFDAAVEDATFALRGLENPIE